MGTFDYIKWVTDYKKGNILSKSKELINEQASQGATDCVAADFKYGAPNTCGRIHLVPAPGNRKMWRNRLKKQRNRFFGNAGCYQFGAIQKWTEKQILSGVDKHGNPLTPGQIAMKTAFGDWASCMMNKCRFSGSTINGCDQ